MKASIELTLRTREVFKLFERKINGDRLFMNTVLHKFNKVMNLRKQPTGLTTYHQMVQTMLTLTQQFTDEINRFEEILEKRRDLTNKKISFLTQYPTAIIVNNPLSMHLVEFIEIYDRLVALMKLLHLADCFTTENDYYANIKRIQTQANKMLSSILLAPQIKESVI